MPIPWSPTSHVCRCIATIHPGCGLLQKHVLKSVPLVESDCNAGSAAGVKRRVQLLVFTGLQC